MNTRHVFDSITLLFSFLSIVISFASSRPTPPQDNEHNWVVPPIDWSSIPRHVLDRMKTYADVPDYDEPAGKSSPGESWVEMERRFHPERFVEGGMHYKANVTTISDVPISQPSISTDALTPDQSASTERKSADDATLSPTAIILFGLLGLTTFLLILTVSYRSAFRRKFKPHTLSPPPLELVKIEKSPSSSNVSSVCPKKIDPSELTKSHQIAEGQFSVVHYALYKGDRSVAIKKAKKDYSDLMANELEALKAAGLHKNIVSLFGSYTEDQSLCLVFEYSHHGDLSGYLSAKRDVSIITINSPIVYQNVVPGQKLLLRSEDLWLYCNQILNALIHLSERNIIHGDVAARNVLVFNHRYVKLSDFGLSHLSKSVFKVKVPRSSTPLPIAWMPPEALSHNTRDFSEKTDIWSFGIYMWEVFSLGRKPYENIPLADIYEHVKKGFRPSIPDSCRTVQANAYWYELMRLTWRENPEERPTFKQIRGYLMDKSLYPS